MRKVRQFADDRQQQENIPQRDSRLCCADNCPNAGTISDSPGGSNWKCWAHDRLQHPSEWPYLTQGIHENLWMFKLADRLAGMSWYEMNHKRQEMESYLNSRGMGYLVRQKNDGEFGEYVKDEPASHWITRIRNAAYSAAYDYVNRHWAA